MQKQKPILIKVLIIIVLLISVNGGVRMLESTYGLKPNTELKNLGFTGNPPIIIFDGNSPDTSEPFSNTLTITNNKVEKTYKTLVLLPDQDGNEVLRAMDIDTSLLPEALNTPAKLSPDQRYVVFSAYNNSDNGRNLFSIEAYVYSIENKTLSRNILEGHTKALEGYYGVYVAPPELTWETSASNTFILTFKVYRNPDGVEKIVEVLKYNADTQKLTVATSFEEGYIAGFPEYIKTYEQELEASAQTKDTLLINPVSEAVANAGEKLAQVALSPVMSWVSGFAGILGAVFAPDQQAIIPSTPQITITTKQPGLGWAVLTAEDAESKVRKEVTKWFVSPTTHSPGIYVWDNPNFVIINFEGVVGILNLSNGKYAKLFGVPYIKDYTREDPNRYYNLAVY